MKRLSFTSNLSRNFCELEALVMTDSGKFGGDDVPEGTKNHREEDSLDELYKAVIMELAKRPHNKGALSDAQIVTKGNNPVCGDRVTVYGHVGKDGKLERVTFEGKACAICTASSSMMTDAVSGKT